MDKQTVLTSLLQRNLSYSFKEGLGFNISYCAADFCNYHICVCLFADPVNEFLNLVCYMGNNLHGRAEVFSASLFIKYIPVDLTGSQVGVFIQVLVNKALIMTEVKVGFGTVLGYIHLAMLKGAHRSGVNIDVRIQLLSRYLKTSCL